MKAFVCVGLAIIWTFIILGIHAHYCMTCCQGYPCNPELYAKVIANSSDGNVVYNEN